MSFTTQQQYDTEFIERQTLGSIKSKKTKAKRARTKGISDWRATYQKPPGLEWLKESNVIQENLMTEANPP